VVTLKYNVSLGGKEMVVYGHGFTVLLHQNDYAVINRDRAISIGQRGKTPLQAGQAW